MKKASTLLFGCAFMLLTQLSSAQTFVNFTVVDPNCAGVEELQEINSLQVYPNPSHGDVNLSITLKADVKELVVTVFNVAGTQVFVKRYENPSQTLNDHYDFTSLAAGTYQMRISIGDRQYNKQLIIK